MGKIAKPQVIWAGADDEIKEVRMRMMREGMVIMPVGRKGQLEGIVDVDNINEFLLIQSAIHQR